MKHVLIGLSILCVVILSLMAGFKLLSRHIFHRTDCERFNIDNIELRTGINIPVILNSDCSCGDGYKNSTFILDTNHVDIKDYAFKNELELIEGTFVAAGDDENTKWEASLNPATSELLIHIEYKGMVGD